MKNIILAILFIPMITYANGEIPSPNMSMPIPAVGVTRGPIYATDINNSLLIIDKHDHSPGNGVPITPAGLNISSDLSFLNNNLTNIRATRFSSQSAPFTSTAPDIGELYSVLGDLYYNDTGGNQIRITQSGSVSGASGTITGLPSGTASASYQSTGGTFKFNQTTSSGANIDAGTYVLRYPGGYPTPTGNYVALQANSSLATGYALTFPATLPGTTGAWMTSDTSGNLSFTNVDNSTLQYSSNVVSVKNLGVTATQIANNTITRAQEAAVGYLLTSSSGNFSSTSTAYVNITNLSGSLTTYGSPVNIFLTSDGSNGSGGAGSGIIQSIATNGNVIITILRNGSVVYEGVLSSASGNVVVPASSIHFFDPVGAGTYTYSVQAKTLSGTFFVAYCVLVAYEI